MIKMLMTADHRKCDEPFGMIEELAAAGKFEEMTPLFKVWKQKNLNHFDLEETILFPETEKGIGHRLPPVAVMLAEHTQIIRILDDMEKAVANKDKNEFLGLADTCMIMIQQHNMKEEQILYTIVENAVPMTEELKRAMEDKLGS